MISCRFVVLCKIPLIFSFEEIYRVFNTQMLPESKFTATKIILSAEIIHWERNVLLIKEVHGIRTISSLNSFDSLGGGEHFSLRLNRE